MNSLAETLAVLRRVWPALAPYADRVVIVGGAAAHLYGLLPGFSPPDLMRALNTVDVDIGLPRPLGVVGGKPLLERFTDAGLPPYERRGESCCATRIDVPLSSVDGTVPYIEFLADGGSDLAQDDLVQGHLRAHLSNPIDCLRSFKKN